MIGHAALGRMDPQAKSPETLSRSGLFLWVDPSSLPEEVVDHVEHLTAIHVDQQDIVIITDPAGPGISRRQAILPRIIDPVAVRIETGTEPQSDRKAAVAVVAIGRIIAADPVQIAIGIAITLPVVPTVVAPVAVPVAPSIAAIGAIVPTVLAAVGPVFPAILPQIATLFTTIFAALLP